MLHDANSDSAKIVLLRDFGLPPDMATKMPTRPLPVRARGYTLTMTLGGEQVVLITSEFADGTLGAIRVEMPCMEGEHHTLMVAFGQVISIGLQRDIRLDDLVDAFLGYKFGVHGKVTGNEYISSATSVFDLVFRELAITYLARVDLVQSC